MFSGKVQGRLTGDGKKMRKEDLPPNPYLDLPTGAFWNPWRLFRHHQKAPVVGFIRLMLLHCYFSGCRTSSLPHSHTRHLQTGSEEGFLYLRRAFSLMGDSRLRRM